LDEPLTDKRIERAFDVLSPEQIVMLREYLSPEIHFLPYAFQFEGQDAWFYESAFMGLN
jgi:hypothetical protein